MQEFQEHSVVKLSGPRGDQAKCWVHSERGAHFHLGSQGWGPSQLRGEGALIIALLSDLPQHIVYPSARALSKLACNCLFTCLSLQLDLEPWEGKGHVLFKSPFPGPDTVSAHRRVSGKLCWKSSTLVFSIRREVIHSSPRSRGEKWLSVLGPQLDRQLL